MMKIDWKAVITQVKKRLWGPLGSVLLHVVAVAVLVKFAVSSSNETAPPVEAVIMETRADELDKPTPELEKEIKQEVEKLPEPVETPTEVKNPTAEYSATEEISNIPNPGTGRGLGTGTGTGVGDGDQAGLQISGAKSPLVMKGLFGSRSSGGRGKALSRYGGGASTEGAVLRALRWLKKEQKANGSWDGPPVAMTSWAILAYLAHGETPASEEFGATVEKAIRYLTNMSGHWPASYQWPIATYALCEAYGMTKVPMIKEAALKGVEGVIRGQGKNGGWCYPVPSPDEGRDTSVMGWCAQALKAAKLSEVESTEAGHKELENSIKQSILGFKANAAPTGGFGYRGPGAGGLTATGVLCMQLLGAAKDVEVRQGLAVMEPWTFKWDEAMPAPNPIYYWYYATQAKFHAGGEVWNAWNKQFSPELVKNQVILKGAGDDGKDIGYWEDPKAGGKPSKGCSTGLTFNTTLCCLMLEVYYRYLPTYKPPEDNKTDADTASSSSSDINIEVK